MKYLVILLLFLQIGCTDMAKDRALTEFREENVMKEQCEYISKCLKRSTIFNAHGFLSTCSLRYTHEYGYILLDGKHLVGASIACHVMDKTNLKGEVK